MSVMSKKKIKISKIKAYFNDFYKAQLSAFIGGSVDYSAMILLKEYVGVHYTIAIVYSGLIGAVVNFLLNRNWSFKRGKYRDPILIQIIKFIPVVANSVFMKALGTFLITNYLGIDYKISRIITDVGVSIIFNFTLQRFWVFKTAKK